MAVHYDAKSQQWKHGREVTQSPEEFVHEEHPTERDNRTGRPQAKKAAPAKAAAPRKAAAKKAAPAAEK